MNTQTYIYGPVPSRRLGLSLGIDIVPYKTCTYDCIYCQLGRTTNKTIERKSFFDPNTVLQQIEQALGNNPELDYITFSGSGEPTLSKDIGILIEETKRFANFPVVVLTNGSLLWDEQLQQELSLADVVIPSVDAVSENVWQKINKPSTQLDFHKVLEGIKSFADTYPDKTIVEIMLVKGINDDMAHLAETREFFDGMKIKMVQLNTVVRSPSEPYAEPVHEETLRMWKEQIHNVVPVEIIGDFSRRALTARRKNIESAVVQLLSRRPCSIREMALSLGIHKNELLKYIAILEKEKKIMKISSAVPREDPQYTIVRNTSRSS